MKKDKKLTKNKERGSKYIGVSKNGSCWQVALILGERKYYVCSVDEVEVAAIINDMVNI